MSAVTTPLSPDSPCGKDIRVRVTLQRDTDARMPPQKLGRTIGVVFEEKVFDRMSLSSRGSCETRASPTPHSSFVPFSSRVPLVLGKNLHDDQTIIFWRPKKEGGMAPGKSAPTLRARYLSVCRAR
jgi:hypothetical protein